MATTLIDEYLNIVNDEATRAYTEAELPQAVMLQLYSYVQSIRDMTTTAVFLNKTYAENTAITTYRAALPAFISTPTQAKLDKINDKFATYQACANTVRDSLPTIDEAFDAIATMVESYRTGNVRFLEQSAVDLIDTYLASVDAAKLAANTKWTNAKTSEDDIEKLGYTNYPADPARVGYIKDGNYGKELNRVSPEGNYYGDPSRLQELIYYYFWSEGTWQLIPEEVDQASSVTLLPTETQEPNTVFRVVDRIGSDGETIWRYFFWSAEEEGWHEIEWYADVTGGPSFLPSSGFKVGEGHKIIEPDVPVFWTGEAWERERISGLNDDLGIVSTVSMYGETLRGLNPDIQLIYVSPTELSLRPTNSDFEYTTVNEAVVDTSKRTSVFSFSPVLDWWEETESFSTSLLQHSTEGNPEEYWVYLANKNDCFNFSTYDFRGRLFCSKTEPINNRLGMSTTDAYNAILIGQCQTAVPANVSDRVEFLYEVNMNISRAADLKETFREFSDFDLEFVDENTLQLDRTYGTAGQMFIGGRLYFIGESLNLNITDTRILVDGNGLLTFDYTTIAVNTLYYVYISNDSDIYNDNAINPATNRPWHDDDEGAGNGTTGPYYINKDLRLRVFLSTKTPEEGRLAETWRGYWARHIGQVRTDGVRKLIYSANISAIRQATLNPAYFDGLAEMTLEYTSTSEMRVIRRKGTSGIVMVGGRGTQLYNSADSTVHKITRTSPLYNYTEANQSSPLSLSGTQLYQHTTVPVYLYLANDRPCWGSLACKLFLSLRSPSDAYLSANYPGNNARWVATLDMDNTGYFTGSYVTDSINQPMLVIDDVNVSPNTLWSSYKNQQMMDSYYNQLASLISAQNVFSIQQSNGLGVRLDYYNANWVVLYPTSGMTTVVVTSGLLRVNVPPSGLWLNVSGAPGVRYYVYLHSNGTLVMLAQGPDNLYSRLQTLGTDLILVGYVGLSNTNTMAGTWNVYSFNNQSASNNVFTLQITNGYSVFFNLPGLVLRDAGSATISRTGTTTAWWRNAITSGSIGHFAAETGYINERWGGESWYIKDFVDLDISYYNTPTTITTPITNFTGGLVQSAYGSSNIIYGGGVAMITATGQLILQRN